MGRDGEVSDLLWPGLHRADVGFHDRDVLGAIVRVEVVWAEVLAESGLVPPSTASVLARSWMGSDGPDADPDGSLLLTRLATAAEGGGNPVIPVLAEVRSRARTIDPEAAAAIHRGLTSQDVLDSALMLCVKDVVIAVVDELDAQIASMADLARAHRDTLMVARTLGQHALPTTFGARVAAWLRGLLVARTRLLDVVVDLPLQLGGAAGTLAAVVELCRVAGRPDPVASAHELVAFTARGLGLQVAAPWATQREPVTRVGDALVTLSDAFGHLAGDVLLQTRPEVGELSEPAAEGRGASSAMPQKRNPVLAVLVRRHAQSAPLLAAQLHLAAASTLDERPDGAWHTEWSPLRDLCLRTLAAARQTTELVAGLEVHPEAMRAHLDAALPGVLAERVVPAIAPHLTGGVSAATASLRQSDSPAMLINTLAPLVEGVLDRADLERLLDPAGYLGMAGTLVDEAVAAATVPRPSLVPPGQGWFGSPPGGWTRPTDP